MPAVTAEALDELLRRLALHPALRDKLRRLVGKSSDQHR
jgi:hypothetical protein